MKNLLTNVRSLRATFIAGAALLVLPLTSVLSPAKADTYRRVVTRTYHHSYRRPVVVTRTYRRPYRRSYTVTRTYRRPYTSTYSRYHRYHRSY